MTSRRDFLKKAGLISAAFAVPALNVNGNTTQSKMRLKNTKIAVDDRWDVIVIGGGPAGCTAAISAAREGAKTLLIEAIGQLGGMGTAGMVPAWCPFSDGEKIIYRGLAEKIFEASRKGVPHERKQKLNWVNINPEYLMQVYDRMVAESGAKVLFFSRVAAVVGIPGGYAIGIFLKNAGMSTGFVFPVVAFTLFAVAMFMLESLMTILLIHSWKKQSVIAIMRN